MNTFNVIVQLISTLAALATAYIAWLALRSWKRQLPAQVDLDVARRLRIAVHKLAISIQDCRRGLLQGEPKERLVPLYSIKAEVESAVIEASSLWKNEPIRARADELYEFVKTYRDSLTQLHDRNYGQGFTESAKIVIPEPGKEDEYGSKLAKAVEALDAITIKYLRP